MKNFKTLLLLIILSVSYGKINSQVTAVDYYIKYNPTTCLFDCCLIVGEGSATTVQQRIQSSSQYSIVIPLGSSLEVKKLNMPLQSNQNYSGKFPAEWKTGSIVEGPAAAPQSTFYSIVPSLSPTASYNNLKKGDTIILFSIEVTPLKECGKGVRLFDNEKDPKSTDPGMNGGLFTNGMTIGGITQRYRKNVIDQSINKPVIESLSLGCGTDLEIKLKAKNVQCKGDLKYNWTGPNGFKSTEKDVLIASPNSLNQGIYHVSVTDVIGCVSTSKIYGSPNLSQNLNHNVKCYKSGSVVLESESGGTWQLQEQSAGNATLSSKDALLTTVSDFSKEGVYKIAHIRDNCSVIYTINVDDECACNIVNKIEQPNIFQYCGNVSEIIKGNTIPQGGIISWEMNKNNAGFQSVSNANGKTNYDMNISEPGTYLFRRLFRNLSDACTDTSNTVKIVVHQGVDAGSDATLYCYKNDTLKLNGSINGVWSVNSSYWQSYISNFNIRPNIAITGFTSPEDLMFVRSNDYCSDTARISILNHCDCLSQRPNRILNVCQNETTEISSSCKLGQWTYAGSEPNKFILSQSQDGIAQIKFLNFTSGNFWFVYKSNGNILDSVQCILRPKPVISLGEDIEFCEDSKPLLIAASGGIRYLWPDGNTSAVMKPFVRNSFNLWVIGYNEFGCSGSDTIKLIMNEKPKGTLVKNVKAEESTYFTLDPGEWTNAATFEWYGPKNFKSKVKKPVIPSLRKDQAGTYYLVVNSNKSCETIASMVVEVIAGPRTNNFERIAGQWNQTTKSGHIFWEIDESEGDYVKYFLERSKDGGNEFAEIGQMKIKNSGSNHISIYSWNDNTITDSGDYIYRIRKTLKSGAYNFSNNAIINPEFLTEKLMFELNPNPATVENTKLMAKIPVNEHTKITIVDSYGRLISEKHYSALNSEDNLLQDLNIRNLHNGTYFIKISTASETKTLSWVVTQ